MILRTPHAKLACALLIGASLALPSAAFGDASTGGTAAPTGGTAAPSSGSILLYAARGALAGGRLRLHGSVPRGLRGHQVLIQKLGAGDVWSTIAGAQADRKGDFSTRWRPARAGRYALRAVAAGAAQARSTGQPAMAHVTVYPSAIATWYGPSSNFGDSTACGVRLTNRTLGVAHRTLPCGTRVEIYYRGRSIVVPVIDRGPYANGASWDLTIATADALGFTSVGVDRVGALPLR